MWNRMLKVVYFMCVIQWKQESAFTTPRNNLLFVDVKVSSAFLFLYFCFSVLKINHLIVALSKAAAKIARPQAQRSRLSQI